MSQQVLPEDSVSYALLRSGPEVPDHEVELSHADAVEVLVLWERNVLHVSHLAGQKNFFVGETDGKQHACDFVLPAAVLGAPRLPIVVGGTKSTRLMVPSAATGGVIEMPGQPALSLASARARGIPSLEYAGAHELPLVRGMRAKLELGEICIQVAAVKAGKPMKKGLGAALDWEVAGYFGLSLLSFGGLLGSMAYFVPPVGFEGDEGIAKERLLLLQQYLDATAERERKIEHSDTGENALSDGGAGTQAAGESGAIGKASSKASNRRYEVRGPQDNTELRLARESALRDAREFGIIGILKEGRTDTRDAPTAPWGEHTSLGNAELSAQGNMWGDEVGDAFGSGLGLSGLGDGAGGLGQGIGLGHVGTMAGGSGLGQLAGLGPGGFGRSLGQNAGTHQVKTPRLNPGVTTVSGRLPPEVIQRVVRQNFGRFRMCYEQGLGRNPNLEGRVAVRFVIGRDGAVSNVTNGGADLADHGVTSCVLSAFYGVSFPPPEGGIVTVTYPLMFTPG